LCVLEFNKVSFVFTHVQVSCDCAYKLLPYTVDFVTLLIISEHNFMILLL